MYELAEHIAESLDIGPGTRVFEVDCGDGAFLLPFHENGYIVGGSDADPAAIARALQMMPDASFQVGIASALDPAVPWHVVICRSLAAAPDLDYARGLLARMFAKATHAIAILGVPEPRRQWMMHALAEIGAAAIQFETALSERGAEPGEAPRESKGFNVFARV
jgi:2-polyprenyl-3-methyl-5-hydroxy-6-metoxy-1,4-benzoquinol methylase